jgi:hypothetical protein
VKFFFAVREEPVGLVASVVLGAETPVHVWEDGLFFEVYCAEDTAAYFRFPSADVESREKRGLSAFSTFLAKLYGNGDFSRAIPSFSILKVTTSILMLRSREYHVHS